jgi:hypothetical protein
MSKHSVLFVSLIALSVGGCGPEESAGSKDKAEREQLSVVSQGITYGGHDYLFVKTPRTWEQAQLLCSINGYKLVTINDADEETFLAKHEAAAGIHNVWIGLNDRVSEGVFSWDGPPSSYTNWSPGQPDNNANAEDCVVDRFGPPGGPVDERWNDDSCNNAYPFICERAPSPTVPRGSFGYRVSGTDSAQTGTRDVSVYLYAGQLFTVATCGVAGASGSGDTYLRVNNPSGQEIASNDDASGACGLSSNLSFIVPTSGTYVIRAGCYGSSACSGTVAYAY